eukprot:CAMPEP_0171334232 /NCGR_PEP_ID=MMETSP0878-20121228/4530_1 /TAXON_ID=67004 /ORGANISM="Thalassiosira weissflogii, Strain CCMP1336" /LENGTH=287 /DNA_ID=CAMNT_0011835299 /DNA_START=21 /DNA_END=884 /DNA_ORIENTATION=-
MTSADYIPNAPQLRQNPGTNVSPGDRLGNAFLPRQKIQLVPGKGAYIRQGHLYASSLGKVCVDRLIPDSSPDRERNCRDDVEHSENVEKWVVSVVCINASERSKSTSGKISSPLQDVYYKGNSRVMCPLIGMVVLGRITRVVRPIHAMVDIMAVVPDDQPNITSRTGLQQNEDNKLVLIPLREPFLGTLRQNDIRPNSSLEIEICDCLRPGDVILARIHAIGGSGGGGGNSDAFVLTTAEAELGVIQAISEVSGCEMMPISWKEMECPVSGVREGRKVAKPRGIKNV